MSYSKYTYQDLKQKLRIKDHKSILFATITPLPISEFLAKTLARNMKIAYRSEKARSEALVFPILIELKERNDDFFTIYSGEDLNVDSKRGLNGECDFILTKNENQYFIDLPIFSIVEAKKNDLELGIPQCAAQMYASILFNAQNDVSLHTIYGCVTTGDSWQFLKLIDNELFIHNQVFYFKELDVILGIFQQIIDFYKKEFKS